MTSYLAVAVFALVVLEVPLGILAANQEYERLTSDVVGDAVVLAALVEEEIENGASTVTLSAEVQAYALESGGRIVVTDAVGVTLADTGAAVPRDMGTRPEIESALAGSRSTGRRTSETLGQELLYVAVPIASDGVVIGAVRITYPTTLVRSRITGQIVGLLAVATVVVAATAVVAWRLSRWATGPVAVIGGAVERFGRGDMEARASVASGPPELVELGARIDDMADRIAALVAAQRGFASDASHQLRTPLTSLRLELENLEETATDDTVIAGLERAVDATQRLGRIVDGLLTLARLEGQRPERDELDLQDIADEAADLWRALANEAGAKIEVRHEHPGVRALAVEDHVTQVLAVALDNALAVAPFGSTITIRTRRVGPRAVVEVADQGPGMSAEERQRAMGRTWQGERPTGGTGLGLAIAQRLAVASRGTLELLEAEGGGLLVRLSLAAS